MKSEDVILRCMYTLCFCLSLVGPGCRKAEHAEPATAEGPPSGAALIANVSTIEPGKAFSVGVYIKMSPGWHTYGVEHGDSGMPPDLAWKIPEGLEAGPPLWPETMKFMEGPLVTYGYESEVLFMRDIDPGSTLKAGDVVQIDCDAAWLVCKDECVPQSASLTLTLPVSTTEQPDVQHAARFNRTRKALPKQ